MKSEYREMGSLIILTLLILSAILNSHFSPQDRFPILDLLPYSTTLFCDGKKGVEPCNLPSAPWRKERIFF